MTGNFPRVLLTSTPVQFAGQPKNLNVRTPGRKVTESRTEYQMIQNLRVGIDHPKLKTMFQRKLRNTGLITNGLLLLAAVVSVAATHQTAATTSQLVNDTTVQQLNFDTTFLRISGISETDALNVPSIVMNRQAKEFVTSYMAKNSEMLKKIQEKSAPSFMVIDRVFNKYRLPVELK